MPKWVSLRSWHSSRSETSLHPILGLWGLISRGNSTKLQNQKPADACRTGVNLVWGCSARELVGLPTDQMCLAGRRQKDSADSLSILDLWARRQQVPRNGG